MPIRRLPQLKPYIWEDMPIGERFGPVEGPLSELKLKMHAFAVDDYHPWYFQSSPFGGRIGHPTLLATDILMLFTLNYDANPPNFQGGLHARAELEFFRPVFVGRKVTIDGTTTEKYQKRGQNYRALEGEARNDAGEVCVRMRATETMGLGEATPVGKSLSAPRQGLITGEIPASAPVAAHASKDIPVGAVVSGLTKGTSFEQSVIYSGFPHGWAEGGCRSMWVNIHTDPEDGRKHGRPDAVVQGLISAAFLSEMCVNFFGKSWFTSGRLSTAFIRPVIVRDLITVAGLVKCVEPEDAGERLWLDVWCKNQRGELTTVGRASALVE